MCIRDRFRTATLGPLLRTESLTLNVGEGLSWVAGQEIRFVLDWEALNPTRARRSIYEGIVDSYDRDSGEIQIGFEVAWQPISGDSIDSGGAANATVSSIFLPAAQGRQGDQGERGFGVTAFATTDPFGTSVSIVNEDGTANADFFVSNGERGLQGPFTAVSYTHLTLPTKRIV